MTYPRPYKPGPIEPIVEVGQHLLIVTQQGGYDLYMVAFIEGIPKSHPLVINLGAIAAAGVTAPITTQPLLDMQYGQVGQFRGRVLDDIWVDLLQPQGVARFPTMNVNANFNAFQALDRAADFNMTEFYVLEQRRPFLRGNNATPNALGQARVAFWGFRYVLAGPEGPSTTTGQLPPIQHYSSINEAMRGQYKFTVIPSAGWGGQ